jgi:hypothetical protein
MARFIEFDTSAFLRSLACDQSIIFVLYCIQMNIMVWQAVRLNSVVCLFLSKNSVIQRAPSLSIVGLCGLHDFKTK